MKGRYSSDGERCSKGVRLVFGSVVAVPLLALSWLHDAMAADPSKGRALYMTHCQNCHGVDGRGQLPGMPNFARGEGLFKPDLELVHSIKSGNGVMPAYQGMFTDNELLDLVAFLRTLR
jgi:mono/diheme cytochrome c family protein